MPPWPPMGIAVVIVRCLCGWSGGIYVRREAPPAEIDCPRPGCPHRITVLGVPR